MRKIPAKKLATVSFAAKPRTTPNTPAEARMPLMLISQLKKMKYVPKRPMAIFPKLLKRGNVLCWRSLLLVLPDVHSIEIMNTFEMIKSQMRMVAVLKIPTSAKSIYSGRLAVLTAMPNPINRME